MTMTMNAFGSLLLLGLLESLSNILPVDNLPNSFDIISPDVLVLQVVGVLEDDGTSLLVLCCIMEE
jgi:hypothetical protein